MTKKKADPHNPRRVTENHIVMGQKLRAARFEAQLSQKALADKLGVSFQQVQKYEKGVNRVDPLRLNQIAEVVGKPIDFFVAINGKRSRATTIADEMLATRECQQVIQAMYDLNDAQRQFLVDVARKLPTFNA